MIDPNSQEWLKEEIPRIIDSPLIQEVGSTPFEQLAPAQMTNILSTWSPLWMHGAIEVAMQAEPPNRSLIAAIGGIASAREYTASLNAQQLVGLQGRQYLNEWNRIGVAHASRKVYARLAEAAQLALRGESLIGQS